MVVPEQIQLNTAMASASRSRATSLHQATTRYEPDSTAASDRCGCQSFEAVLSTLLHANRATDVRQLGIANPNAVPCLDYLWQLQTKVSQPLCNLA